MREKMPITSRWKLLLASTLIASLGAATLIWGVRDFAGFFGRYVPSSIAAHLDKAPVVNPKSDETVGTGGPEPRAEPESEQTVRTSRAIDTDSPATLAKPKSDEPVGTASAVVTVSEKPATVASLPILPLVTLADDTCLSKQRLATGAVLFKDECTKEWAINSTSVTGHRVDRKCLRKSRHPGGVVMFKDICTDEWALNTAEIAQQSEPTD
jgi:hypothetical protein